MTASALFFLPHASVGKFYHQTPQLRHVDHQSVVIVAIDIEPKTGLVFDDNSQQLTGEPLQAGDYVATVYYQSLIHGERSPIKTTSCPLLINSDPRSLWKNIPSDPQQLYAKPDAQSQTLENKQFSMLAASQRGRSHAHKGQSREDDFYINSGENWYIAIVADGAGSAKYSRYGSQLICQMMGRFLVYALSRPMPLYQMDIQLELREALTEVWSCLEEEVERQQATIKDYASTVLVVVCYFDVSQQRYVYISLAVGDGVIALYQPQTQQLQLLNRPDTGDYAGETCFLTAASLVNTSALMQVFSSPVFVPCLLMTDGVSDAFFDSDNSLNSPSAWQVLWQELAKNHALEDDKKLLAWLDFWSTGNHDDRTIIIVEPKNYE